MSNGVEGQKKDGEMKKVFGLVILFMGLICGSIYSGEVAYTTWESAIYKSEQTLCRNMLKWGPGGGIIDGARHRDIVSDEKNGLCKIVPKGTHCMVRQTMGLQYPGSSSEGAICEIVGIKLYSTEQGTQYPGVWYISGGDLHPGIRWERSGPEEPKNTNTPNDTDGQIDTKPNAVKEKIAFESLIKMMSNLDISLSKFRSVAELLSAKSPSGLTQDDKRTLQKLLPDILSQSIKMEKSVEEIQSLISLDNKRLISKKVIEMKSQVTEILVLLRSKKQMI